MTIGQAFTLAIEMMTEKDFWDKFNRKHNPQFYEKLKKKKTENKKKIYKSRTAKGHPVFKVSD